MQHMYDARHAARARLVVTRAKAKERLEEALASGAQVVTRRELRAAQQAQSDSDARRFLSGVAAHLRDGGCDDGAVHDAAVAAQRAAGLADHEAARVVPDDLLPSMLPPALRRCDPAGAFPMPLGAADAALVAAVPPAATVATEEDAVATAQWGPAVARAVARATGSGGSGGVRTLRRQPDADRGPPSPPREPQRPQLVFVCVAKCLATLEVPAVAALFRHDSSLGATAAAPHAAGAAPVPELREHLRQLNPEQQAAVCMAAAAYLDGVLATLPVPQRHTALFRSIRTLILALLPPKCVGQALPGRDRTTAMAGVVNPESYRRLPLTLFITGGAGTGASTASTALRCTTSVCVGACAHTPPALQRHPPLPHTHREDAGRQDARALCAGLRRRPHGRLGALGHGWRRRRIRRRRGRRRPPRRRPAGDGHHRCRGCRYVTRPRTRGPPGTGTLAARCLSLTSPVPPPVTVSRSRCTALGAPTLWKVCGFMPGRTTPRHVTRETSDRLARLSTLVIDEVSMARYTVHRLRCSWPPEPSLAFLTSFPCRLCIGKKKKNPRCAPPCRLAAPAPRSSHTSLASSSLRRASTMSRLEASASYVRRVSRLRAASRTVSSGLRVATCRA